MKAIKMACKNPEETTVTKPLEERCLLVTFMQPPPVGAKEEEKVCDRLQIYFQKKKIGGGDVDKVLYPLPGHSGKAIVQFSTDSNADIHNLLRGKHVVNIRSGVDLDITTEILPKMFQEVKIVVDGFYWLLLPRDKTDELTNLLKTNANATLDNSSGSGAGATIIIPDSTYMNNVRDVFAGVVGLQTRDESSMNDHDSKDALIGTSSQNGGNRRQMPTFPNSGDGSVRPKVHTSTHGNDDSAWSKERTQNHVSNDDGKWDDDEEQSRMTPQHSPRDSHSMAPQRNQDMETNEGSPKKSRHAGNSVPLSSSRMAANLGNQTNSNMKMSRPSGNMKGDGENGDPGRSEGGTDEPDEAAYRGPFTVNTLYYKYLVEKCKEDLDGICQKYSVEIDYEADKKNGGEGKVMIKQQGDPTTRCTPKELEQAEDAFISLYQSWYQRLITKQVGCQGVDEKMVGSAKSNLMKEMPSVLLEDSLDEEVTLIGEEDDIGKAIPIFRVAIGQQPRSRKLKSVTASSSSAMSISSTASHSTSHDRATSGGWRSFANTSSDKIFKTNEGIDVIVRKDDITKQTVDIIVNAANSGLQHYNGVAGAIKCAAGPSLQDDCDEITRRNGDCPETNCVFTQGYKLSCNFVVHAVGPVYDMYKKARKQDEFFTKLKLTFSNCFSEASNLQARSIAVPLISSGIFGGPKDVCARVLVGAIKKYSSMATNRTIDKIILVNTDDEACDAIVTALNWLNDDDGQMETGSSSSESGGLPSMPRSHFWKETVTPSESSTWHHRNESSAAMAPIATKSSVRVISAFNNGDVQIIVEEQGLLEMAQTVDSIVIPTDQMLNPRRIAGDVARAAGSRFGRECEKLLAARTGGLGFNIGEIAHSHGFDLFHGTFIFVVAPNEAIDSGRQNLYDKFVDMVLQCLRYANKNLQVQSVALPLFTTKDHFKELCSEALAAGVSQFTNQKVPKNIQKIHIVSDDEGSNMALQLAFQEQFHDDSRSDGATQSVRGAHAHLRNASAKAEDQGFGDDKWSHDRGRVDSKGSESMDTLGKGDPEKDEIKDEDSDEEDKRCPICLDDFGDDKPAVNQGKCKHKFCRECLDEAMKRKPVCPVCGVVYGMMKGNQPRGHMNVTQSPYGSLPGFAGCGMITISYSFNSGTQGPDHPEPGRPYSGTHRTAYLPNNAEGKKVLALLRRAFDARLTFTIGTSVTTGVRNAVTWNDIHHKTSMSGGPQSFGYPDPTYLSRVTEELAAKGIK